MGRAIVISILLALAALIASGCGRTEKTTYVTPGGKVTVKKERSGEKAQKVEIETKEGKATVNVDTDQNITQAELGLPVYPGAKVQSSGKYEQNQGSGVPKMEQYTMTTTDSVDDVEAFYKSRLKNVKNSYTGTSEGKKNVIFVIGDGNNQTSVSISSGSDKKNETLIHVIKIRK